ncbi:MAG TPA: endo-1,4-beta-xylanase [Lacipirellulaceae bacterium]|nr:endo-1,4-beta-xylanase [Lacipirellulaceae bacterium]
MGLMRLIVHDRDRIPAGGLEQVHMCGSDDLPWFGRAYFSGNQLIIERNEQDSGRVFVPWRVGQSGSLLINTSTLMERDRPYILEVELARGMLNNLRNQIAQWEMMGLVVPASLRGKVLEATSDFSRAASSQDDLPAAADWAEHALATSVNAMRDLTAEYTKQALASRRSQDRQFTSWFGVHLGGQLPKPNVARHVVNTFNMVSLPFTWRTIEAVEGRRNWTQADAQIEWARSTGLRICAGPLLELDDRGVPDWTYLWEGDFDSLLSFMLEHVHAVVDRYRGKVHLWQVAARMTHGHALGLGEESRLQVAAKAINVVRQLDPTTPLVVTFDQPWAEYLASEQLDLAPMHFADALVRADLGLSGLGLEINVGYHPGGSLHRGPLAISRLVDTWSLLELPLLVALTLPSSADEDAQANAKVRVLSGAPDEVSPQSQCDWVSEHIPLLLAKNAVQVVLWNQLSDSAPHHYPHGGVFDAADQPKPALEALKKIRHQYLNGGAK